MTQAYYCRPLYAWFALASVVGAPIQPTTFNSSSVLLTRVKNDLFWFRNERRNTFLSDLCTGLRYLSRRGQFRRVYTDCISIAIYQNQEFHGWPLTYGRNWYRTKATKRFSVQLECTYWANCSIWHSVTLGQFGLAQSPKTITVLV